MGKWGRSPFISLGQSSLPGQEGLEMPGHNAVEYALFGQAGTILEGGFADGEALAGARTIALLVSDFLRENGSWIWADHSFRSTPCSLWATTCLTGEQSI